MVTRSIATVSLSGTLDEKLKVIAAANFDAVEIFESDLLAFNERPRDIAARCRDLGRAAIGEPARQAGLELVGLFRLRFGIGHRGVPS